MWGKTEVEVMTGLKQDATEWSTTTLGELLVLFPSVPKTPLLFSAQRSLSLFQRLINPSKFDSVCSSFQTAQILTTLPGHKASVNCTHWLPSSKFAFKDGVVNLWEVSFPSQSSDECKVLCLDTLSVDSKAIVTLSLAELPQSHTDWIRSLDFSLPLHSTEEATSSIMLVSSSEDKVIRIWKLVLLGDVGSWQREIILASYIEGPVLVSGTFTYQISFESVLIGHEDWVYSVEWQPPVTGHQALSILSASMDKVNLWKRRYKLYGHGNELFSLCCDHNGTLVASSCKAQAEICLWEVGTWKAVGRLQSHSLTVTHLEFSYDDTLLLSVSRDSHFSVFSIQRTVTNSWQRLKHTRGSSGHVHGTQFTTSSRDKTVKIWSVEKDARIKQVLALPQFGSSVTAVAWTGLDHKDKSGCIAVGMESGLIELWNIKIKETEEEGTTATAALVLRLEPFMCHVSAVNG
ncbi:hypothetical protein F2Q69_00058386 [Brassica cretica]|uniref:Elongator complex protein 2 n=1 Tax=Brassica cretica TaxID=69181 RepID=A0A8S9RAM7_BRACR|nr:hypothetical protein F2Q69_00058386 [Brassica cretica]